MPYDELPDDQLMTLVVQGDRTAVGALYDRHARAAFGFVFRMLQERARAEEVIQEVFLNVWLKAASFRPQKGKFITWLMTMAHNRAVDELRRTRRDRERLDQVKLLTLADTGTAEGNPAQGAQQAEEATVVRVALKGLPPAQRQVIELAYYQGLTQSEIAGHLQHPLGTVKTRMRLGMQKLRAALAGYEELL